MTPIDTPHVEYDQGRRIAGRLLAASLVFAGLSAGGQPAFSQGAVELRSEVAQSKIDRMLASARVSRIALDAAGLRELEYDVAIGDPDMDTGAQYPLGGSFGIDVHRDSLYVADFTQNRILAAYTRSNVFERTVGSSGSGPGEFLRIQSVARSDSLMFVGDGARGVQVLDNGGRYVASIATGQSIHGLGVGTNLVAVADPQEREHLIQVLDAIPPFAQVGSILPRLTSQSDPARAYNRPLLSMNGAGVVLCGYFGIPVLFVYDPEQKLAHALIFQGRQIDEATADRGLKFGFYQMGSWVSGLAISDGGRIAISNASGLYILDPVGDSYLLSHRIKPIAHGKRVYAAGLAFDGEDAIMLASPSSTRVFRYLIGSSLDSQ